MGLGKRRETLKKQTYHSGDCDGASNRMRTQWSGLSNEPSVSKSLSQSYLKVSDV